MVDVGRAVVAGIGEPVPGGIDERPRFVLIRHPPDKGDESRTLNLNLVLDSLPCDWTLVFLQH